MKSPHHSSVRIYEPGSGISIKHPCVAHLYGLKFYSAFTEAKTAAVDVGKASNIGVEIMFYYNGWRNAPAHL